MDWIQCVTILSATTRRTGCTSASSTGATATAGAGERRHRVHAHTVVRVGVNHLITNPVPVLVNPYHRLLKQARLRVSFRHRALHDIELVFMHRDIGEGAGLIGVVGQLYEVSFNHVLPFPSETCQLGVPLKELERRIYDRPSLILLPVPGTDDGAGVCTALLVAGRTRL